MVSDIPYVDRFEYNALLIEVVQALYNKGMVRPSQTIRRSCTTISTDPLYLFRSTAMLSFPLVPSYSARLLWLTESLSQLHQIPVALPHPLIFELIALISFE